MADRDDGGSVPCVRCGLPSSHKQGRQWFCPKHYRFGQMRANAKRHGKLVPSVDELADMVKENMACGDCERKMNWLGRDGQISVVTLQHYRDGSFGLVCRSCNVRHAHAPGDQFRDHPKDHKYCPACEVFKPFSAFSVDNGRSGEMKMKSSCKLCARLSHAAWMKSKAMLADRAKGG